MILGLIKTIGLRGSLFVEQSITNTLTFSPICGAASPTPFCAYIVSKRSLTKSEIFLDTLCTSLETSLNEGSP